MTTDHTIAEQNARAALENRQDAARLRAGLEGLPSIISALATAVDGTHHWACEREGQLLVLHAEGCRNEGCVDRVAALNALRLLLSPAPAAEEAGQPRCEDCGLPYTSPQWVDAVVSDDVWERLSGRADGGGLLCLACMDRRAGALGIIITPVLYWASRESGGYSVPEADRPAAGEPAALSGTPTIDHQAARWNEEIANPQPAALPPEALLTEEEIMRASNMTVVWASYRAVARAQLAKARKAWEAAESSFSDERREEGQLMDAAMWEARKDVF